MPQHKIPILDLIAQIEDKTLPQSDWHHQTHVRATLFYILNTPTIEDALCSVRSYVIRYQPSPALAAERFNQTKTTFWVKQIAKFVTENRTKSLEELDDLVVTAPIYNKDYIYNFYSKERANSVSARANFISPDIQAF